eukprot:gene26673-biopygen3955
MLGARYRETFEESSSNNQKYLSVVHTQPSHRVFIDDIEESITTDVMSVLAPLDAYGLTVVRGSKGPDALRKLEKERGYTHVTFSRLIVADALSALISLPTGSLLVVTLFDSYSVLLLFAGPSMSSASSSSTLRGIAAEKGSSSLVVHCVGQVSAGAVSILEKLMQRQNNTKPVVPAMTLITAPRNIDPTLTADTSSKLHKYDVLAVWGSPEFIRVTVNAMGSNTSAGPTCSRNNDDDDGGSSSVLFIKYDADLKFLYFCERCDTFWKAGGGRSAAADSSKNAVADSSKDADADSPKDAATDSPKDAATDSPKDAATDSPKDAATDAVSDSPKDVVAGIDDVVGERKSRAKVIGMRAEQIARGAPALIDVPRMMGSRRFDACEVASAELDAGLLPLVVARTLSDGKTELVRISKSSSTS